MIFIDPAKYTGTWNPKRADKPAEFTEPAEREGDLYSQGDDLYSFMQAD